MFFLGRDLVSASLAGIVTTVVVTPLDTARTRMQMNSQPQSGWTILFKMRQEEGIRSLYKGMSAPLAAQAVYKMVLFSSFGITSRAIATSPSYPPIGFLCGAFAGFLNSFVVTPVELIRSKLAVQKGFVNLRYSGPRAVLKSVGSIRGLFRGLTGTLSRDCPGMGVYFATFHSVKDFLGKTSSMVIPGFLLVPFSGACAGVAFWTYALPFDSAKTLMQTSESELTLFQALQRVNVLQVYRSGYTLCLARGIPGAALTFSVQNAVSNYIDELFAKE